MNITVIGASAGIGLETVKRALSRNHRVTTLSRSGIRLPANPLLHQISGSALVKENIEDALENADAVIITLGTGNSVKATTLYSEFAALLLDWQKVYQSKIPFIILTGFGAGDSGAYNTFLLKLAFRFVLNKVYADKTIMEQKIAASGLNWVIVRPGLLTNKPLTEEYRVETRLYKGMNIGAISRADVADYLVKQAENPTALKQYPALSKK